MKINLSKVPSSASGKAGTQIQVRVTLEKCFRGWPFLTEGAGCCSSKSIAADFFLWLMIWKSFSFFLKIEGFDIAKSNWETWAQELANYSPWGQTWLTRAFVNIGTRPHPFVYILLAAFLLQAELNNCVRDHIPTKLKIFPIRPFTGNACWPLPYQGLRLVLEVVVGGAFCVPPPEPWGGDHVSYVLVAAAPSGMLSTVSAQWMFEGLVYSKVPTKKRIVCSLREGSRLGRKSFS